MGTKVINKEVMEVRRVIKLGGSLVIVLPFDWCYNNEVEAGDEMALEADGPKLTLMPLEFVIKEAEPKP